jgi:hypothetical protein
MSTGEWVGFIALTAISTAALAYGSGLDISSLSLSSGTAGEVLAQAGNALGGIVSAGGGLVPQRGTLQGYGPTTAERDAAKLGATRRGSVATERMGSVDVQVFGGNAVERDSALAATRNVFRYSTRGLIMRYALEAPIRQSDGGSSLPPPLVIVLGAENGTYAQISTRTVAVDLKDVGKSYDSLRPGGIRTFERLMAHELGHVALGYVDLGPGMMDNVIANENPVMRELGDTNDRMSY